MNLYLTLDYELFLGENSGTPENCLINPMNELCRVAEKHNCKFVIYVDAAYLYRMQQLCSIYPDVQKQFTLVCNHVRSLAEKGHDVQLHFHPQWLYSDWDDMHGQWVIDRNHYKLSDLTLSEARSSLSYSKNLLDDIIGYKTTAFRAGGFCLDPFAPYAGIFKELGLVIDSSVARGLAISSPIHNFDYRVVPKEQIYRFEKSVKEKDDLGDFVEMSISSATWSFLKYYLKIRPIRSNFHPTRIYKDGNGIVDSQPSLASKLHNFFSSKHIIMSFDWEWSNLLPLFVNYARKNGQNDIILLGHPKNASDQSIKNLDRFLSNAKDIEIRTTVSLL